ncbi:apoptosis-antagonizing transcription factor [Polychytrium aggregatum]|uniref:apoptosis-antagonizing transcription factor n=1 Tax=Polychytrium aggregatum TaxID=110093 RepID=UPI0022FDC565|nr:apoptosis-antagonizing transcription factor [Polychytrium aggregatum]KAI9207471.1 apoptosis-antagonizing transcription factor [Polychytrium aggregatum]
MTSRKRRTLGELLTDLANPAPSTFDPEKADGFSTFDRPADESFLDDQDMDAGREHYVDVGRSSIRTKIGSIVEDPKYAGKRANRKSLFDADEPSSADDEDDYGEDDDNEDQDDDDEDEDDDDDEDEDDDEDDDEDEDGEEDEDEYGDGDYDDREGRKLADELAELQAEESKLIKTLSQTAKGDAEKGRHVRNQMNIWETLLDCRIRMQQVATIANRLPHNDVYPLFMEHAPAKEETAQDLNAATRGLGSLVESLLEFRKELVSKNDTVTMTPEISSKKRKYDYDDPDSLLGSMWTDIKELDTSFQAYRNTTIEKWSNKVQAASGIPLHKKFKSINQSVLSQIKTIMNDRERLVKRTRLKRSEYRTLGQAASKSSDEAEGTQPDVAEADAHLANHDAEIFDDSDYYQQLLKELIESRMTETDDPVALSMRWAQLKQLQGKKKKANVDTKASKGRKIRYHVIEKLQNFMAPEPRGSWHEEMISELFQSLLGKHSGSSAGVSGTGPANSGDIPITNDGLKVFG